MQALRRSLIAAAATLSAAVAVALVPGPVYATGGGLGGFGNQGPVTQGNSDHGTLSATAAGVQFDKSKNGTGAGAGPLTPVSNWTPPACWYAPTHTPEEAASDFLGFDKSPNHTGMEEAQAIRDRYVNGHP